MNTRPLTLIIGLALGGLGANGPAAHAQTSTPPAPGTVPARLVFDGATRDIDLVGRDKDTLFFRPRGGPAGASTTLKIGAIASGEFDLALDGEALSKALFAEDWPQAATLLLPVVTPLLPYLDIVDNNGVDPAMDAGRVLMRAAHNLIKAGGAPNLERGTNVHRRALALFRAVSVAAWSPEAANARLRAVQCLCALRELPLAAKELEAIPEPEVGDAVFGLYWLARAQLRYAQGQTRDAMNAAVQSLAFDNKSIETFPDALFMTARCYEDLLEWHRARDVYYELARLFPRTEFGDTARQRLKIIMDKELTKVREISPIEVVFFGLDEDVNAKAAALLGGEEPATDAASDDDIERDAAEAAAAAPKEKQTTEEEGEKPK